MGKIKQQDQAIAVNYVIYNTGTNDLYIRDVKPDCKCTAGVVDKTKPIQPGDSTQVTLKYGPKHPGVFQVSAVVEMNARQSPLLLLRGEVVE